MFGLGGVLYVSVLLINAVAILSEDRFLARINLSPGTHEPGFGASGDSQSVQAKIVNLIASVRTLMRSKDIPPDCAVVLAPDSGKYSDNIVSAGFGLKCKRGGSLRG
ncbi:hypothetical protein Golomagni_06364, partial [Golovinomyces magnicellulatus]